MIKSSRKITVVIDRRRKVAEMYLRGKSQFEIAQKLGCDRTTISKDLKALRIEWLQSALVDLNEAKARELAKIDHLETTYWTAWARSLRDAVTITREAVTGKEREIAAVVLSAQTDDGNTVEAIMREVEKREGQSGNPAFLAGIQWCINKRCEILGLDAPKKQDISGNVEITRKHDLSKLSTEELRAWRELMVKTQNG
jgi:hypothetical protein